MEQLPQSASFNNQRRTYLTFAILTNKPNELHVYIMEDHPRNQSYKYCTMYSLHFQQLEEKKKKNNQPRNYELKIS